MQQRITEQLQSIAQERNIRILLACETGSRAWGFPSPDSDYDVRIIYAHERDWYISLNEQKDSIELMLDNGELDITGWELRKSLRLLWKSNAALLERLQSPIAYVKDDVFLEGIAPIAQRCYSPIATMHHYLSMARKCLEDLNGNEAYMLKLMFYGLRASTACLWILEHSTPPPIEFKKMLHGLQLDQIFVDHVEHLIKLKSGKNESYVHPKEPMVEAFMEKTLERAETQVNSLPSSKADINDLNDFLRSTIR